MFRALLNLLTALGTGFILFFFSERLFWTVIWPGATCVDLVVTWLAYSAVAYLFLAVVHWSRASDLPSVFLCGAVYGWLIEGGIANTLYGTQDSAPFPMSISLTALSWHALISVMLGWWATKRAMAAQSTWPLVALSAALGAFWGLWATFPRQESPPILVSVERFAGEALAWTLLLGASWWILERVPSRGTLRPGWCALAFSMLIVALFYVQHVMALGGRALILLPTLVGGALVLLTLQREHGQSGPTETLLHAAPVRLPRLLALLTMPAVATIVFGAAVSLGWDRLPIAAMVYMVTGAAGFVLLSVSIGCIVWRR
jgi:hypothetical protein